MPFSTMCDNIEERIQERMYGPGYKDRGDYFISGDYSNATDAMNMDATALVINRIVENCGLSGTLLGERAIASLQGAWVEYPDGQRIKQTRGQLMGHPLSFPILCLINLSTYVCLFDVETLGELCRSRLLVNGDDILFQGQYRSYSDWRYYGAMTGLVVNESKTYVHKKWTLINSVLSKRGSTVPYYNRALAIGHRVKSEPRRLITQSGQIWEDLGRIEGRVAKTGRRHFLKTLKSQLPKVRGRGGRNYVPNYFVHKELGGLGLKNGEGREVKITTDQRRVATYFARNPMRKRAIEKIGSAPTACEQAVKHALKMSPAVESWLIDGRPVHGPLPFLEDAEALQDLYMKRSLMCKSWVLNQKPFDSDTHLIRLFVSEALRHKEKPMSKKKILNHQNQRFRVATAAIPAKPLWNTIDHCIPASSS